MLSKLPIYYIQRFVILVMSVAVVLGGFFTFGDAELFDRIFLGLLIALIIYFRDDKNLASIFAIIAIGRVFEELIWLVLSDLNIVKALIYGICMWTFYLIRYDILAKLAMAVTGVVICAEIYWFYTKYENAPSVIWYVLTALQDLLIRHFVFLRPVIFKKWISPISSLPLDLQIYQIAGVFVVVQLIIISEYLARHLLGLDSLIVYTYYPYVAHILGVSMLWVTLNYSLKRTSLFNA